MPRLQEADAEARKGKSAEFLEALSRGLRIIQSFSELPSPTTLTDIANNVNLPRATVRRTLLTLASMGYVSSEGRKFELTSKILDLATAYLISNKVNTLYQPVCDHLSKTLGVTISVAVLDEHDAHYIATASSERGVLQEASVGYRIPLYCSSLGRVLLAGQSDDELEDYFKMADLKPLNNRTVTDKADLAALIQTARADGYALVDQEANLGFRSIAVPLRRYDGVTIAALAAGARIELATNDALVQDCLPVLQRTAADLLKQIV